MEVAVGVAVAAQNHGIGPAAIAFAHPGAGWEKPTGVDATQAPDAFDHCFCTTYELPPTRIVSCCWLQMSPISSNEGSSHPERGSGSVTVSMISCDAAEV